jgi:hypothetical protein
MIDIPFYSQRRSAVTEEILMAFMDPKRQIDPTPSVTAVAAAT